MAMGLPERCVPPTVPPILMLTARSEKAHSRDGGFVLGLSIAASIIERHCGRIWCEGRPDGNAFLVELKRVQLRKRRSGQARFSF